jgi:hypothetical protein
MSDDRHHPIIASKEFTGFHPSALLITFVGKRYVYGRMLCTKREDLEGIEGTIVLSDYDSKPQWVRVEGYMPQDSLEYLNFLRSHGWSINNVAVAQYDWVEDKTTKAEQ